MIQNFFDMFSHAELWLVGGAVRDLFMGIPMEDAEDLDFATNLRPDEIVEVLAKANMPIFGIGAKYGTIGTRYKDKDVQITTYRKHETYSEGSRHPEVVFGDTIGEDLLRRDLTINAIAWNPTDGFFDPYLGRHDLNTKRLNTPGDPHDAFREDPLRMLRVARFQSRYGFGFDLDGGTYQAMAWERAGISMVSAERIFTEMTKLLTSDYPTLGLQTLQDAQILEIILPEVVDLIGLHKKISVPTKDLWHHVKQVVQQAPNSPALRWAALLHDTGKAWTWDVDGEKATFYGHEEKSAQMFQDIRQRLKFPNDLAKEVEFICRHHGRLNSYDEKWTDAAIRRLCKLFGDYTEAMIEFAKADITSSEIERVERYTYLVEHFATRVEELDEANDLRVDLPKGIGSEIMREFSLSPGPKVGETKTLIEEAVLDGKILNSQRMSYYLDWLKNEA